MISKFKVWLQWISDTNEFVASIAERQEINPEFANLLGKP